jgi:hypothetical protein
MAAPVQQVNIKLNIVPGTVQTPKIGNLSAGAPRVGGLGGAAAGAAAGGAGEAAGLGSVLGPIGAGLGVVAGGIAAIAGAVAVAQPGTFKLFTQSLEDIAGVIGHTLAPVLKVVTQGVRLFGDILASILPSKAQMNELMAPFKQLMDELRGLFQELIPVLRPLIDDFVSLTKVLVTLWTGGLRIIVAFIKATLGDLGEPLKSARGAAARQTAFAGIPGLGEQARLSAFRGGIDPQQAYQQRTETLFDRIDRNVTTITNVMVGTSAVAGSTVRVGAIGVRNTLDHLLGRATDAIQGRQ